MIGRAVEYLKSAIGAEVKVSDVRGELRLSPMVASLYDFARFTMEATSFALMVARDDAIVKPTPAAIEAHARLISEQLLGLPVVYVAKRLESYNRLRLLGRKIPFIVPGRQLYLPFINTILSDVGVKKVKEFSSLGVVAQMLLLASLNLQKRTFSIAEAVRLTGYTRISVMKAFDELEYFGLAMRDRATRHLVFREDRRALFDEARSLLKNPCRRRISLEFLPDDLAVIKSGIDALSDISMIAPGDCREYAVLSSEALKRKDLVEVPRESASVRLELWSYRPAFLYGDRIDPLSLCLSLSDETDDRVQGEVEEVLEGFKW